MAGTREIARNAGIDGELAQRFVDALLLRISQGERVTLRGFGSFQLKALPARTFNTPLMREPSHKPERITVAFRPSPLLLADLNRKD